MAFLLDTNVFAAIAQPKPQRAVERAFVRHAQELVTSAVVLHEMWFGIERMPRSRRRAELERFMSDVVSGVRVLPYGERAARWHADVAGRRTDRRHRGRARRDTHNGQRDAL
jgi:predicted nucleic acid-binding protein